MGNKDSYKYGLVKHRDKCSVEVKKLNGIIFCSYLLISRHYFPKNSTADNLYFKFCLNDIIVFLCLGGIYIAS